MAMRILVSVVFLVGLAGPARAATSTDTFVSVEADGILTLDPAAMYDLESLSVALNIYEPLVVYGTDPVKMPFAPFLAAEVPTGDNGLLSADGRVYSFPIRKDVRFHDGSQLCAEDVRYSLLRFLLADTPGGPSAMLLEPILGVPSTRGKGGKLRVSYEAAAQAVRTEGDRVVVTLKKPDASFLDILASWPMVLSKSWAVAHGEWDGAEASWTRFNQRPMEESDIRFLANGTGPFVLDSTDSARGLIVLRRNDFYWRGPAALKTVVFHEVRSEVMRLAMLQAGDADYAQLSRSSLRDLAGSPDIKVLDDIDNWATGQTLFFNFGVNPVGTRALGSGRLDGKGIPPDFFADPDVRRGFAHAFNFEMFRDYALRGKGVRVFGPVPFDMFDWKTGPAPYDYDRGRAAESFRKAAGGKVWAKGFRAEIFFDAVSGEAQAAADLLASELRAISPSFDLVPKPVPRNAFLKALEERRLPLFIASFGPDFPDPHSYAFNLMHSAGFFPRLQRYAQPQADALVDEARGLSDEAAREKLYRKLQDLYQQDLPQVYLCRPVAFKALRGGVVAPKTDLWLGSFSLHNALYFYRLHKH
ncbi:MAG: ABC transporter substrate-binding protein [Elusimicrobia bacterium]|nr:ABC transporter substrate-binding protein [Elusimicrobiota bacterium]